MDWKKYLKKDESTITYGYPNTGIHAMAGDDDYPIGNILIGGPYVKKDYYNRLTTFNINWEPDDSDWQWGGFDSAHGQGTMQNYCDTLKNFFLTDRLFKHMHNGVAKPIPKRSRWLKNDLGPFTDGWGDEEMHQKTANMEYTDNTNNTNDEYVKDDEVHEDINIEDKIISLLAEDKYK